MQPTVEQLLASVGIPATCPTCNCPVWKVSADTQHGINSVECEQCRRTYVRGTTRDKLIHDVGELHHALYRPGDEWTIKRSYGRMVNSWYAYQADPGGSTVYCINVGTGGDVEVDELPF